MKELTAKEFVHAYNRMCGETKCCKCPLCDIECDITVAKEKDIDKIVDTVTEWAEKHPENREKEPEPKVYPKHCIVKLVPYEEAVKREKETALPDDTIIAKSPWGISKDGYDKLQSDTVNIMTFHHRDMADGEHTIYTALGMHAYFIPDIFIDEVLQDLDKED